MAEQRFKTLHFISLFLLCALSVQISESNQTPEFCYKGEYAGCRSPMTSKILIKGRIVVNAHHQEIADVYVEDGIIVLVQSKIKAGDDVIVIDATGKYVMPGGIDSHTHLGMEFMGSETIDDCFSDQAAALVGGTTMHIDFALPINGSLSASFEAYPKKARMACMDYGFHMAVTKWDEVVSRGMEIWVKEKVHVMSIDVMEEIAKAQKSDQEVVGEAVVSGLVLDDSALWDPDFTTAAKYVMSPPIREVGHALCIDDFKKIPNGLNGIEERMHLIWDKMVESGQISATDYVRVTNTECARVFNIYPRKGAILAGFDADIIILNPNASFKILSSSHHSRSDINVYEGRKGKGKVEVTIVGGNVVWENGELKVEPGSGRYIDMPSFGHLFSGIGKADDVYLSSLRAPIHRVKSAT
ncbi:hypothetical protein GIB67_035001 [Kingdonia uniflora]|uniref:dihydropyrimidinase n=1 Tax=Kingdonia uniflora TaxID=39325 RepID=A0A7J7M3X2_9MAGN|nr:hypothetical protein GIB67_035001 [Kingdonia uniflora]